MNKEEAIKKMEIEPVGYECPIKVDIFAKSITEQRENYIMEKVNEVMDVEVNKDELAKALMHDRNQYYEGYRNGFLEGYRQGIEQGKDIVIEELKRGIEARFMRELDVKENRHD